MLEAPPETEAPPVVTATGGADASDLAKRLKRYGTAKRHTQSILRDLGSARGKSIGLKFVRIMQCGDFLRFRDYYTVKQMKLVRANFCMNHLVCGFCAIRRASRAMASYLDRYKTIRKAQPELRPYLVTLTVKNGHDLPERLGHLFANLRKLHRRRSRKNCPSVMHSVAGGVYAVELTHDPVTGWHPHAHAIWLSDEYPTATAVSSEWLDLTGDSFIVDVEPLRSEQQQSDDVDPYAGGFAECFKYAMKPAELGADLLAIAYPALSQRRLMGSFGCFRGVPEPDDLADDISAFDSLPYEEILFRFFGGRYQLHRTQLYDHPHHDA
jgi:hypothetical protein